jgi:colicin import membrane protein
MKNKMKVDASFRRALNRSLLLHAILLVVVIARVAFPSQPARPMTSLASNNNPLPIQASVVDTAGTPAPAVKEAEKKLAEQKKADAQKKKVAAEKAASEKKLAERKKADAQKKKVAAEKAASEKKLAEQKKAAAAKKLAEQKAVASTKAAADAKAKALAEALEAERMPVAAAGGAMSGENLREIDRYKLLVQQQIMRYWFVQGSMNSGIATQLYVKVAPNGAVLDVKISRSSGNDALDRSAMAAVYKASPLPVPQDPTLFNAFRELRLTLRPDAVVSEG